MCIQQIIYGVQIKRIRHFIDLIGVFYFCDIFGRCNDTFTAKDSDDLLQAQRILLNG